MNDWPPDPMYLCDVLAGLFHRNADIERLARGAGLDVGRIAWDARPLNTWQSILQQAPDRGRLEALLAGVLEEASANADLQRAVQTYRETGQVCAPEPSGRDFADLERAYLSWLQRVHGRLELRGIRVQGQLPTVPLDRVFVASKGGRTHPGEAAQSRLLLEEEARALESDPAWQRMPEHRRRYARHYILADFPYMPSLYERDRPAVLAERQVEILNLAVAVSGDENTAILYAIAHNTLAVLGPVPERRSEWRDTLTALRNQATAAGDRPMVAFVDAVLALLDAGGNPAGLGGGLAGVYAVVWQALVGALAQRPQGT